VIQEPRFVQVDVDKCAGVPRASLTLKASQCKSRGGWFFEHAVPNVLMSTNSFQCAGGYEYHKFQKRTLVANGVLHLP